jgi:hypothetical protein
LKTAHERQRVYVFETAQKTAIGSLVASYRPALANWIREAESSRRRVKQVGRLNHGIFYVLMFLLFIVLT